jgi:tetratricopeptide (TPR) repeat protein
MSEEHSKQETPTTETFENKIIVLNGDELPEDELKGMAGTSLDVAKDDVKQQGPIKLSREDSNVILRLFNVLSKMGYIEEALSLIDMLVVDSPANAKYFRQRADIYRVQGRLLDSIADAKKAIRLLLADINQQMGTFQFDKAPPHMMVESAAIALLDLKIFLDKHAVPFFLTDGTLLGLHRDGELLSYDHDIDIGVPWHIPRQELVDLIFQSENFDIPEDQLARSEFDWNFSVLHKNHGIAIDFFFFKPEGEFLDCGLHHLPTPMIWRFTAFSTKLIQYRGNDYCVPENPEQYLAEIYGPGWKVPDPYFDSLVAGHNLTPESKFLSLCYAYTRLYGLVSKARWKWALDYCEQIFRYEKESWLVELANWLQVKINESQ